tara:strand:+ start:431 stop:745 length:315 start_codon:yes stop_codon:yes gene_type:complete
MPKKTKKQKIKEHLESGKKITPREAIVLYNHYRLAAVIFELKQEGLKIKTDYHFPKDGGQYASYYLDINSDENKQVKMFSDNPQTFRSWLDEEPPKFDEKKHIR